MNAVESFVCTGTLPTARTHSVAVVTVVSAVRIVRTTSTSFMSGTGLKKCSPRTCCGRLVAAAIAVTLHDEVFDARIAWGAQIRSSFAKVSFFTAWFSVIVEPVMAGMVAEGHPFRGFLYVGLMLTSSGPKVIEFNVRLGDPEAQVVLPLVDEPLLPILAAAAGGALRQSSVRLGGDSFTGVVVASRGYPDSSESGHTIRGVELAEAIPGVAVYHAATARRGSDLVTAGGRVLTVVGRGADFAEAIARAYAGVMQISFDGMQYRHDIGRKAFKSAI